MRAAEATLSAAATAPSAPPSTQPAADLTFQSDAGHFRITYSGTWKSTGSARTTSGDYQDKKVSDTTVLTLLPAGAKSDEPSISIDLPSLPPHIPGLIPLGLVTSGYISDLRKQHPELKVEESADFQVPDARARRVRLAWKEKDGDGFDLAVIVIHNDQILIFSADGDAGDNQSVRKAFDQVVSSIHWLK